MKFKDLTDKDVESLRDAYLECKEDDDCNVEEVQRELGKKFNVTGRTIRDWLRALGFTEKAYKNALYDHPQYVKAKEREIPESKYYLVSWEQNKTPYCGNLLMGMEKLAKRINGEILIVLGRYQNPTSIYMNDTRINNQGWHRNLEKYHCTTNIKLHKNLFLRADIKVRPTAINPLTGFKSLGGTKSVIIGHPKLHLQTPPLPKSYKTKTIQTTGAITYPNYTDSKAGARGEEKHKLGFTLVEIKDEDVFFTRQIEADSDGNFRFLDFKYEDGELTRGNSVDSIIFGDRHGKKVDKEVDDLNDKLVDKLKPKNTVFHDIVDGESVNNHIRKKPFEKFERYEKEEHLIKNELEHLKKDISDKIDKGYEHMYIVRSNHDDRFDRYLESEDWKKDIPNAKEYMRYALAKLEGKAPKGVIPYFIDKHFKEYDVTTLGLEDPLLLGIYACHMHGHIGVNGSRGSLNALAKVDIPKILGHYHKTARKDDTITVGSNTVKDLGYNVGPSSQSESNVIIHDNGIAEQCIIIKGETTTLIDD